MATATATKPKSTSKPKDAKSTETATEKAAARNAAKQPLIKVAKDAMRKSDRPIHSKEFCIPKSEGGLELMNETDQDWLYLQLLAASREKDGEVVKVEGKATFDLREKNPQGWPVRGVDPAKAAAEEKARKEAEKKAKAEAKAKADAEKAAKTKEVKEPVGTDGGPATTQPKASEVRAAQKQAA